MTSYIMDIEEIFLKIISNLNDYYEIIQCCLLSKIHNSWIRSYHWPNISIFIRSFEQFEYFLLNHNFKQFRLTNLFFQNKKNIQSLLSKIMHNNNTCENELYVSKLLSCNLSIDPVLIPKESDEISPLNLIQFFLRHNYQPFINGNQIVLRGSNHKQIIFVTYTGSQIATWKSMLDSYPSLRQQSIIFRLNNSMILCTITATSTYTQAIYVAKLQEITELIYQLNQQPSQCLCYNLFAKIYDTPCILGMIDLLPKIDVIPDLIDGHFDAWQKTKFLKDSKTVSLALIILLFPAVKDILCGPYVLSLSMSFKNIHTEILWKRQSRSDIWEALITSDIQILNYSLEKIRYDDMSIITNMCKDNGDLCNYKFFHKACARGNLDIVKYLYKNPKCMSERNLHYDDSTWLKMIRNNQSQILKWWVSECHWPPKLSQCPKLYRAIFSSQIETFKIMVKLKVLPIRFPQRCKLTRRYHNEFRSVNPHILSEAAIKGNIEVLNHWFQYLFDIVRRNISPTDNPIDIFRSLFSSSYHIVITTASEYNNLDVIKWWIRKGLPFYYTCQAFNVACNNGHLEIINYFLQLTNKKNVSSENIEFNIWENNKWREPFVLLYTMKSITRINKYETLVQVVDLWKKHQLFYNRLDTTIAQIEKKFPNKPIRELF